MKETLIVWILIIGCAINSKCQVWYNLGAEWHFNNELLLEYPAHGYVKYTVEQDTMIESLPAKLIVRTRHSFVDGSVSKVDTLFVREENEQVYSWNGTTFDLMYDFSLKVGDTLDVEVLQRNCDSVSPIVVDSITELEIDNTILRVQHLSYSYMINSQLDTTTKSVIEFIGQIEDFLFEPACGIDVNGFGNNLLRCYSDNNISFKSNWWSLSYPNAPCDTAINGATRIDPIYENYNLSIYPNPFVDNLTISHRSSIIQSISIFNVSGKLLLMYLPHVHSTQINLVKLQKGFYHIIIKTEDETVSKTIIKQ